MTCTIHHFPMRPITDDGQLTAALNVSSRVFSGEWVPLKAMIAARDVIDSRTRAKATVALLNVHIDARRDEIRRDAKRGTTRRELVDCVGLAVVVCVAVGVLAL